MMKISQTQLRKLFRILGTNPKRAEKQLVKLLWSIDAEASIDVFSILKAWKDARPGWEKMWKRVTALGTIAAVGANAATKRHLMSTWDTTYFDKAPLDS